MTNTTHLKQTHQNLHFTEPSQKLSLTDAVGKYLTKTAGSIFLKLKLFIINFANECEGAMASLKNRVQSHLTSSENFQFSMKKFTYYDKFSILFNKL